MPPSTPVKCRGSVVRQLSLQGQTPLQSPNRHKLKKQLSEDDGRMLDSVEVTGQGWMSSVERSDSLLRIGYSDGKFGQAKITGNRPKPAKVAWADKKQESVEYPMGVEVVATKCQGQPRPLSNKIQRFRSPLLGNKDTLVYTRLQLAERLRNAWSEREKTKPNLNIFLAHASDTTRSDNPPSDRQPDNASTLSDSTERKRRPLQLRAFSHDYTPPELPQDKLEISPFGLKLQGGYFKQDKNEDGLDGKDGANGQETTSEDGPRVQELNKIEIRVAKNDSSTSDDKENVPGTEQVESETVAVQPVSLSAKDRRGNFRNSGILNKTITDSFSGQLPMSAGSSDLRPAEDVVQVKKPAPKKQLVRALSAPTSHDQPIHEKQGIQQQQKSVKFLPQKQLQSIATFEASDDITAIRERIKSAPIRRKLKSAAARRKSKCKAESSSEDEKEGKDEGTATKKATRRGHRKTGADIITMVSLVSPTGSDTEDSVINLPMESMPAGDDGGDVEGQKAMTPSSQTKPSKDQETLGTSFVLQKFVSLRKTAKTVSFQQHPNVARNYSSSFPSRRAPAGTPIIIPSPVISNPALTPAQLQERDKRPPLFPGPDGRGIKRRFTRSTSEPTKEDDSCEEAPKPRIVSSGLFENFEKATDKSLESREDIGEDPESGEPEFKCPKERECWSLYKKMLAKGVSVSFDTVLRGMLTPTEYRLRKNRLLSNC